MSRQSGIETYPAPYSTGYTRRVMSSSSARQRSLDAWSTHKTRLAHVPEPGCAGPYLRYVADLPRESEACPHIFEFRRRLVKNRAFQNWMEIPSPTPKQDHDVMWEMYQLAQNVNSNGVKHTDLCHVGQTSADGRNLTPREYIKLVENALATRWEEAERSTWWDSICFQAHRQLSCRSTAFALSDDVEPLDGKIALQSCSNYDCDSDCDCDWKSDMAELDDKDADLLVGVPVVDTDSQSILSIRM